MTVTNDNYFELFDRLDTTGLPDAFLKFHADIAANVERFTWAFYDEDDDLGGAKARQFALLGKYLAEQGKDGNRRPAGPDTGEGKSKAPKKRKGGGAHKAKAKANSGPGPEMVRETGVELGIISRFANLHGKTVGYTRVLNLFNALNKAISKGQVRKTSSPTPYHKEMAWIQGKLEAALRKVWPGGDDGKLAAIEFDPDEVKRLKALHKGFQVRPAVRLGLRYFGMEGKSPDKQKAGALLEALKSARKKGGLKDDDPDHGLIKAMESSLQDYIKGNAARVKLQAATLHGLAGAVLARAAQPVRGGGKCGCGPGRALAGLDAAEGMGSGGKGYVIAPPRGRPLTFQADRLPSGNEDVLRFTGRWAGLFNQPVRGFTALVYGRPKSGKSTLTMDFAGYLARDFGHVLYASIEEGVRGTITERVRRLGAGHPRLAISNHLPADLGRYDFVVTDSVSRGSLDLAGMRSLINRWPRVSFIFIFHVTKDGLPRGTAEFQHEVDVIVEVKDGHAEAIGRFGPGSAEVRFE